MPATTSACLPSPRILLRKETLRLVRPAGSVMLWSLGASDPSCVLRMHRADIKAGSRARHPDANGVSYQTDRAPRGGDRVHREFLV